MSLLTIVQDVCDQTGLPRPSAVAASTQSYARQLLALTKLEVRELSELYDWPDLILPKTFDTAVGVDTYDLPADFDKMVSETAYVADEYYRLRGSLSPSQWERRKSAGVGVAARTGFRVYRAAGKIKLNPMPDSVQAVVFEYKTKNRVTGAGNTPQPTFTLDTDEPVVSDHLVSLGLKWRIKHAKGIEFSVDLNEYNDAVRRNLSQQMGGDIPIGSPSDGCDPCVTDGNIRETGYGQ